MIKKFIDNELRDSWLITLFFSPKLYLFTILKHVFFMGFFTLCMSYFYFNSEYSNIKIPTTTHTLISVAIGLLLVFRTQSAYERWTTASQNFYNMKASFALLSFKIKNSITNIEDYNRFRTIIRSFTYNFAAFLKENNPQESANYEIKYLSDLENLVSECNLKITNDSHTNTILRIINDIMQNSSSCVRIKETPIPKSYEMHIKISIFLYILSLPFGLFYEMGMWSVFVVMFVYYIIAGIEIISREIENPFHNDPNDLPIGKYMEKIRSCLD